MHGSLFKPNNIIFTNTDKLGVLWNIMSDNNGDADIHDVSVSNGYTR